MKQSLVKFLFFIFLPFIACLSCRETNTEDKALFAPITVVEINTKNYKAENEVLNSLVNYYLQVLDSVQGPQSVIRVDTNANVEDTPNAYRLTFGIEENHDKRIDSKEFRYAIYERLSDSVLHKPYISPFPQNFSEIGVYPSNAHIDRIYTIEDLHSLFRMGRVSGMTYVGEMLNSPDFDEDAFSISVDEIEMSGSFSQDEKTYIHRLINNTFIHNHNRISTAEKYNGEKFNFHPNFLNDQKHSSEFTLNLKLTKKYKDQNDLIIQFEYQQNGKREFNKLIPTKLRDEISIKNGDEINFADLNTELSREIRGFIDNQLFFDTI